ncbi:ABC transporter substrate-binding protein [Vibrio sp. 10N]|uniref:ABC transporter substrate-binding protein n=1 Tax=Vibrio sp. 10N TaxID=3058938 RepID=UPI002813462F|nr:hypothetical protein VB10N_16170 [Vibrio sp. 10N]
MGRVPIMMLCATLLLGCGEKETTQSLPKDVTVVTGLQPGASLLYLAHAAERFEKQNLNLTIEPRPSGTLALRSVIDGEIDADVIFAADIAYLARQHLLPDYRVVATVFDSDNSNAIASLQPFSSLADLENKVLCTQYVSALHFFGQALAERSGAQNVIFKFVPVSELNRHLIEGECDYITIREPFVSELISQTNQTGFVKYFPGTFLQYELMLAHRRLSDEDVSRLLLAMIDAESVLEEQPDYAKQVLMDSFNADAKQVQKLLADSVLSVSLYQPLIALFDREFVWLQSHGLSADSTTDTKNLLRPKPLRDAAPLRQTILDYENEY